MEQTYGMFKISIQANDQAMVTPLRRVHASAIEALRPIDGSMAMTAVTHVVTMLSHDGTIKHIHRHAVARLQAVPSVVEIIYCRRLRHDLIQRGAPDCSPF